jgi:predicted Na+-dependent transporter
MSLAPERETTASTRWQRRSGWSLLVAVLSALVALFFPISGNEVAWYKLVVAYALILFGAGVTLVFGVISLKREGHRAGTVALIVLSALLLLSSLLEFF